MKKSIALTIILPLFFFLAMVSISTYAQVDINNLPWYLKINNVKELWDNGIKGRGVIVEVWDSKVRFDSLLKNKNNGYKSYISECSKKTEDYKSSIHGTGMASLIASDYGIVKCSILSQHECKKISIAGLAPAATIFNRELVNFCREFSSQNIFELLLESLDLSLNLNEEKYNSYGKKIFIDENDAKESKIILINASVNLGKDIDNEFNLSKLKKHENYPYVLIIAAVGNVRTLLTEYNLPLPAGLKIKGLTLVKVGATNKYTDASTVNIYGYKNKQGEWGSAYGDIVDILAPGEEIPILTHELEAYVGDGTSESTCCGLLS